MIYRFIGKVVVQLAWFGLRRKFVVRTALITGAGVAVGVTAVGVAGYLLTREVPEA
ncbi:MAG: hypothetical protein M9938_10690 [Solirubrobacterales bacterium]|nr:hypothetical protein [Solirubrobacterales bacterium]